ncbi:MAG TPA: cytochrome c, partial [Caldilineaceae bacterium]|nr:cytochrome c [Caldilineaceae bacterium]
MSGRQWRWSLAALAMSLIVLAACTDRAETIPTPALTLATPAPAGGQAAQNLPAELVVILVTPTSPGGGAAAETGAAEGGGGGQQVAQAQQATPGAEGGGEAQQATPAAGDQGGQAQADTGSAGQMSEEELISMGEQVYTTNCASCHQPNGQGSGAYPALSGNPFVTAEDSTQVIQTVVQGRGQMPAFGNSLSSEQIAAVVSYIRNAW